MLAWLLRVGLAGVFLLAGVTKLLDPFAFVSALRAYQLLPESLIDAAAFILPRAETALALGLLLGLFPKVLPRLAQVLLIVFALVVSHQLIAGKSIDCGCFGHGERLDWKTLVRDLGFIGLTQALITLDAPGVFRTARAERRAALAVMAATLIAGVLVPTWRVESYCVAPLPLPPEEILYHMWPGSKYEPLNVQDMVGRAIELTLDSSRQVLLLVDVRCSICGGVASWMERNLSRMPGNSALVIVALGMADEKLSGPSAEQDYGFARLLGLEAARDTVKSWNLRTPVYFDVHGSQSNDSQLGTMPQVLLIENGYVTAGFAAAKQTPVRHPDVLEALVRSASGGP